MVIFPHKTGNLYQFLNYSISSLFKHSFIWNIIYIILKTDTIFWPLFKQECIPVGCVLTTAVAAGGVSVQLTTAMATRGVSVQGRLCPGGSLWGDLCQEGDLSKEGGSLSRMGLCLKGGLCPEGVCVLKVVSVRVGSLFRGSPSRVETPLPHGQTDAYENITVPCGR